ncbi:hypothetical protein HDU96_008266 [Phlyctochytrium bullatum]|nr:hypothetical protein HDU96_008266 [Phlyctochytrium bullatum]
MPPSTASSSAAGGATPAAIASAVKHLMTAAPSASSAALLPSTLRTAAVAVGSTIASQIHPSRRIQGPEATIKLHIDVTGGDVVELDLPSSNGSGSSPTSPKGGAFMPTAKSPTSPAGYSVLDYYTNGPGKQAEFAEDVGVRKTPKRRHHIVEGVAVINLNQEFPDVGHLAMRLEGWLEVDSHKVALGWMGSGAVSMRTTDRAAEPIKRRLCSHVFTTELSPEIEGMKTGEYSVPFSLKLPLQSPASVATEFYSITYTITAAVLPNRIPSQSSIKPLSHATHPLTVRRVRRQDPGYVRDATTELCGISDDRMVRWAVSVPAEVFEDEGVLPLKIKMRTGRRGVVLKGVEAVFKQTTYFRIVALQEMSPVTREVERLNALVPQRIKIGNPLTITFLAPSSPTSPTQPPSPTRSIRSARGFRSPASGFSTRRRVATAPSARSRPASPAVPKIPPRTRFPSIRVKPQPATSEGARDAEEQQRAEESLSVTTSFGPRPEAPSSAIATADPSSPLGSTPSDAAPDDTVARHYHQEAVVRASEDGRTATRATLLVPLAPRNRLAARDFLPSTRMREVRRVHFVVLRVSYWVPRPRNGDLAGFLAGHRADRTMEIVVPVVVVQRARAG